MKYLTVSILVICVVLNSSRISAQWIQTNGPYGGYICSLAAVPNGNGGSNLLAGDGSNGVILSTDNGKNWTQTNLNSGYVYSFAQAPNNNGGTNIFAATTGPGIYLSTDYGNNWEMVNADFWASASLVSFINSKGNTVLGAGEINGISLSYDNGKNWIIVDTTIKNVRTLIGVSDGSGGTNLLAGTYGNGVYISINGGINWKQTELKDRYTVAFATIPNDKGGITIFAGNDNSGGVWISTDNGINWSQSNAGLSSQCISSLAVSGTTVFAGTAYGVFRSTNNGASWMQSIDGLPNIDIRSLGVSSDEAGNSYIFAGTYGSGVFHSTNGGLTWGHSDKGIADTHTEALLYMGGTNIVAGGMYGGVFTSNDNGLNWTQTNLKSNVSSLAASKSGNGTMNIFAGSYCQGVLRSTDQGVNWMQTGLTGVSVRALDVLPNETGGTNVFAGTQNNGVFLSKDNGMSWTAVNNGLTDKYICSFAASTTKAGNTNLFVGTNESGVFRSTDNGETWTQVNNGFDAPFIHVSALALCSTNLFAGIWGGVFRSTNNGTSWTRVSTGLQNSSVKSLAVAGMNLFAGTGIGVFQSSNNGTSWTSAGLSNAPIYALAVSGLNLFAADYNGCVWKRPLSEMISSMWKADITIKDNGNISQSLTFGKSHIGTDGIDIDLGEASLPPPPFGFDARFHLPNGDDSWVDYRVDAKDTLAWIVKFQPGNGGYPMTCSWDPRQLPGGTFMLRDVVTGTIVNVDMKACSSYAVTNTGITSLKIEHIADPPTAVHESRAAVPADYALMQNYPNPFNPSTVIRYDTPKTSRVRISVYNLLGMKVATLVDGMMSPGSHEAVWDASGLASGMYVYTIDASDAQGKTVFRLAKKMILMR